METMSPQQQHKIYEGTAVENSNFTSLVRGKNCKAVQIIIFFVFYRFLFLGVETGSAHLER